MGKLANVSKMGNHPLLDMIHEQYPGYHPIMSIAEMAHRKSISPEVELSCHKTILEYVTPKVKSIEVSQGDNRRRVTISMFGEDDDAEEIDVYRANGDDQLITVK